MKQVSPEVESCNNQPNSLDEESILESTINRAFVRLDMVDEEEHCKEELPSTLFRNHHFMHSHSSSYSLTISAVHFP